MATFTVGDTVDNYIQSLENLMESAEPGMKVAVYKGAEVIANAVRKEIQSIPIGKSEGKYISAKQRAGLLKGLGISHMENEDGYVNVRIGENGYNSIKTMKYPKGQPNAVIARGLISGTSGFREKNDFIGRAVRKSKKQAEAAMASALDAYIKGKMNKK